MGEVFAVIVGLCAGTVTGGALCAFYLALGLFSELSLSLRLSMGAKKAAASAAVGGVFGTVMTVFNTETTAGPIAAGAFGLFCGLYAGIFIACLTEVVSLLPTVKKYLNFRTCVVAALLAFAVGKLTGSVLYWILGES